MFNLPAVNVITPSPNYFVISPCRCSDKVLSSTGRNMRLAVRGRPLTTFGVNSIDPITAAHVKSHKGFEEGPNLEGGSVKCGAQQSHLTAPAPDKIVSYC